MIASAILTLMRARKMRVGAMKPVETGVARGEAGSDHVQLAVAAGMDPDCVDLCPIVLEEPRAPWIASRRRGQEIPIEALDESFARVRNGSDGVLVEGAGGLLVPITRTLRYDILFARWELDLVIVAADRLGAINHALLTVEAAHRAGLRIRGVVLNQVHKVKPLPPGTDNASALRELLPDIPIVEFPCIEGLYGGKRLHEYGAPLDLQLLRDVSLGTGLTRMVFGSEE